MSAMHTNPGVCLPAAHVRSWPQDGAKQPQNICSREESGNERMQQAREELGIKDDTLIQQLVV